MTSTNQIRKSFVAIAAVGIVLFSLTGLDSTLKPTHSTSLYQTSAQVTA